MANEGQGLGDRFNGKYIVIPRITTSEENLLTFENGMMWYNSDTKIFKKYENGTSKNLGTGGNTEWGNITGSLINQTDLQSSLDNKLNSTVYNNILTDTWEPTGFPSLTSSGDPDRTSSIISYNNSTRIFTIQPSGSSFAFYNGGIKYTVTSSMSVSGSNVEGKQYFYFDTDGTLKQTLTFDDTLILQKTLVSQIYWNISSQSCLLGGVIDERHGIKMDGTTHNWIHDVYGTRYDSGLSIYNFTIGDGSSNSHSQFSVNSGTIFDEDLPFSIPAYTNTIPIYYKSGSNNVWRTLSNAGYAVFTTGSGRLAYNNNSTYSISECTDGYYTACHIFATNGSNETAGQLISVMGQNQYLTLQQALDNAPNIVGSLGRSVLPSNEVKCIGTIILQTSSSFTNATKSKIVQPDGINNYLDWRFEAPVAVLSSAVNHDSLSNVNIAGLGVNFGHINNQTQNIDGAKTLLQQTNFNNGVLIDNSDIELSNPATGVLIQTKNKAENIIKFRNNHFDWEVQNSIYDKNGGLFIPTGAGTTITIIGMGNTASGTPTARTPTFTNKFLQTKRIGYVSAAGAGSVAGTQNGILQYFYNSSATLGGFTYKAKWGISDAAIKTTGRVFIGLWGTATAITNVEPSTLTNKFCFCCDSTDTTLKFSYCGSTIGNNQIINLGANFPVNQVTNQDFYDCRIHVDHLGVYYYCKNLHTNNETNGFVAYNAANMVAANTLMSPQIQRNNGTNAGACGIDVLSQEIYPNNG